MIKIILATFVSLALSASAFADPQPPIKPNCPKIAGTYIEQDCGGSSRSLIPNSDKIVIGQNSDCDLISINGDNLWVGMKTTTSVDNLDGSKDYSEARVPQWDPSQTVMSVSDVLTFYDQNNLTLNVKYTITAQKLTQDLVDFGITCVYTR